MSKLSSDLSSVTVVGLDLAKHVFQVHCIDGEGRVLLNRSCAVRCSRRRSKPSLCDIEFVLESKAFSLIRDVRDFRM
jgi:hypothetical protein